MATFRRQEVQMESKLPSELRLWGNFSFTCGSIVRLFREKGLNYGESTDRVSFLLGDIGL
jgi:hypothetical protein